MISKEDKLEVVQKNIVNPLNNFTNYITIGVPEHSNMTATLSNIGDLHNEMLDYQWNYIKDNPSIPSNITAATYFESIYEEFLLMKGIDIEIALNPMVKNIGYGSIIDLNTIKSSVQGFSEQYWNIVDSIFNSLDLFDQDSTGILFNTNLNVIESQITNVSNLNEQIILSITLEIARKSSNYWASNLSGYASDLEIFIDSNSDKFTNSSGVSGVVVKRNRINIKELVEWDLSGAYAAGKWGLVAAGGPAGAIACGLTGGAGASCANIIWQSIWK